MIRFVGGRERSESCSVRMLCESRANWSSRATTKLGSKAMSSSVIAFEARALSGATNCFLQTEDESRTWASVWDATFSTTVLPQHDRTGSACFAEGDRLVAFPETLHSSQHPDFDELRHQRLIEPFGQRQCHCGKHPTKLTTAINQTKTGRRKIGGVNTSLIYVTTSPTPIPRWLVMVPGSFPAFPTGRGGLRGSIAPSLLRFKRRLRTRQQVQFLQREANTENVRRLLLRPVTVCGDDECVIR
jgi:hypothetical protein